MFLILFKTILIWGLSFGFFFSPFDGLWWVQYIHAYVLYMQCKTGYRTGVIGPMCERMHSVEFYYIHSFAATSSA